MNLAFPSGLDPRNMWVDACPSYLAPLVAFAERCSNKHGIIEFGAGFYSTPILAGLSTKRFAVSVEPDPLFRSFFRLPFETDGPLENPGPAKNRGMRFMEELLPALFNPRLLNPAVKRWGVALVDSRPSKERINIVRALKPFAEVIILHDTEPQREDIYGWKNVWQEFNHVWHFDYYTPRTTVVSNTVDVAAVMRKMVLPCVSSGLDSEVIERNHKV